MNKITRRLLPLYIATFFSGVIFWYAVEKIFMTQIGFSNSGIILAMVLMVGTTLVFEVPSGVIADRWSRKGVLMLAQISLAFSSLAGFLSENPMVYLLSAGLWGLYAAMNSGVAESIVYDTLLEEQGNRKGFEKYYGRNRIAISASLVTSALVGGVLASAFDERFTFIVSIPSVIFGIAALLALKEPVLHKTGEVVSMKAHITDSIKLFRSSELIILICIVTALFNAVYRYLLEFYQIWLVTLEMKVVYFGVVLALLNLSFGIAGIVAHRFMNRHISVPSLGVAVFLSVLTLVVPSLWLVVPSLFVSITTLSIIGILLTGKLHDNIPSSSRSGISSAVSTIGTAIFIVSSLLVSLVADKSIYLTVPMLLVLLFIALAYSIKAQRRAIPQDA